jgi:mannose-6-phosphate isomerase-like protein (cupin superfamily)
MDKIKNQILKELLPAEKDVAPPAARAQAGKEKPALQLDHWTSAAILLERAAYLHKLAKQGDGSAGETLKEYPRHCAMLSFRSRDGEAEVHENFADVFYVLDGRATLVTGGTVAGARLTKPGETRGTRLRVECGRSCGRAMWRTCRRACRIRCWWPASRR